MTASDLPPVNASLNALSAIFLTLGFVFIKRGRKMAHRNCMIAALITSTIFLVCYLIYHFTVVAVTKFQGVGWVRPVYFFVLISHVILAVVIVPLVLVTITRAARGEFDRHARMARWAWPLWMYVSVTGVAVYVMLYQLYPAK